VRSSLPGGDPIQTIFAPSDYILFSRPFAKLISDFPLDSGVVGVLVFSWFLNNG
jgi:hypothetical protein